MRRRKADLPAKVCEVWRWPSGWQIVGERVTWLVAWRWPFVSRIRYPKG